MAYALTSILIVLAAIANLGAAQLGSPDNSQIYDGPYIQVYPPADLSQNQQTCSPRSTMCPLFFAFIQSFGGVYDGRHGNNSRGATSSGPNQCQSKHATGIHTALHSFEFQRKCIMAPDSHRICICRKWKAMPRWIRWIRQLHAKPIIYEMQLLYCGPIQSYSL